MPIRKPAEIFDRDWEWAQLDRFVSDDEPGASLGIVSGRRRQGKTFLLESACEAAGGFYYAATEAVPRQEALRQLAEEYARYTRSPGTLHFADWGEAIDALLGLATRRSMPVVLDEFPYLVREAADLPSTIQKALSPGRAGTRQSR